MIAPEAITGEMEKQLHTNRCLTSSGLILLRKKSELSGGGRVSATDAPMNGSRA